MWPPKFSDCIEACNTARRRCERLITTALAQCDVNVVAATIGIARDCARIATLTTQLLERGSKYAYALCEVCARACEELAKACEKHADIEAFSRCAEACRKWCRRMRQARQAQKAIQTLEYSWQAWPTLPSGTDAVFMRSRKSELAREPRCDSTAFA